MTFVHVDELAPPSQVRPRPRLGLWAAMVAGALVVLSFLPSADPASPQLLRDGELPPPTDDRLLPWPGLGPWASDQAFVTEAARAWRAAARSDPGVDPPGDRVVPLWAGPVLDARMALLQSVGPDDVVRVAQISDMLYGWLQPRLRLLATARVDAEPEFVSFPFVGPDDRRGQLDPDVLATFQMLPGPHVRSGEHTVLRVEGRRLVPITVQDDGLSAPWAYGRWWQREDPEVALLTRSADGSVVAAVRLDPDSLLPAPPPVTLVEPIWPADRPQAPQDYIVAAAALEAVGSSTGRAAVLGAAHTSVGLASLVQIEPPGSTQPSAVVVVSTDSAVEVSRSTPLRSGAEVAIGAARMAQGELVVVAAAPSPATSLAIEVDGVVVTTGRRTQAMVIPRDRQVSTVAALASRDEGSTPARATVTVTDDGDR